MAKILVSGLVNIETTLKINGFPINYFPVNYPFFGINSSVSGVARNVSKALATLGDNVNLISYLGSDFDGNRIEEELASEGVSTKYIERILQQTPQSIILYDDTGNREIYCDLKDIQDKLYDVEDETILDCDLAVICNINFNRSLLKRAKAKGITIATDVHVLENIDDEYNQEFLEYADIIFLSDEKLPCDPRDFLTKLKERYPVKIIVIGMGSKGAMLYHRETNTYLLQSCVKNDKVVNTLGAGDALFSGFIHYYTKGVSPSEALKYAQTFASHKIGFNGAAAGFLNEKELERLKK